MSNKNKKAVSSQGDLEKASHHLPRMEDREPVSQPFFAGWKKQSHPLRVQHIPDQNIMIPAKRQSKIATAIVKGQAHRGPGHCLVGLIDYGVEVKLGAEASGAGGRRGSS